MHGKSIAWVRDRCRLIEGHRALLYAVATHADKHFAMCSASAATLARSSGLSHRHVQRLLPDLVEMGVLDRLYEGRGRKPAAYRIAPPLWVEGTASGSGVVEGEASASGLVEGTVELSTDSASYDTMTQQSTAGNGAEPRSYDMTDPVATTWPIRSYDTPPPLTSTDGAQEKYLEEKNVEEKNVPRSSSLAQNASSHAGRAQALDAVYTPPEVSEAQREWLRRRGLGQKQPPPVARLAPPPPDQPAPTRTQDEQLAELERRYPDQFKSGQEQEPARVDAVAQPATIELKAGIAQAAVAVAQPATIELKAGIAQAAVAVHAQAGGHRVEVGQAQEVELAGEVRAAASAGGTLRAVNE